MKLTAKKSNGTILFKEVDSNDKNYINILKKKGWSEVKEEKPKVKKPSKKVKKSTKK